MFEKKRGLSRDQIRMYKKFSESYVLSVVLNFLGQRQGLKLQVLSRFYYDI